MKRAAQERGVVAVVGVGGEGDGGENNISNTDASPQHKKASLMPGCFPNLDVTSGYIAVRNFHQLFPNVISASNNENNDEGNNENESCVPEMPPELDVSEFMPITYKDYIMQTIQDSLVKKRLSKPIHPSHKKNVLIHFVFIFIFHSQQKNTKQKPEELVDEIFVKKASKYRFIKKGELGDTVAARLCGFETPEAAHLPQLKTLGFIKKFIAFKEGSDKGRNGDEDNEGEEEDENWDTEEDEEEGVDEGDDEENEEARILANKRKRSNMESKRYAHMIKYICRGEVPSAPVSAKELKRSLAGLTKGTADTTAGAQTSDLPNTTSKDGNGKPSEGHEDSGDCEFEAVDPKDVVLRVTFYNNYIKAQEFYVLGSQRLVELRDAIDCVMDHLERVNEHGASTTNNNNNSNNGAAGTATGSVKFFKSASFLIENVFYNDLRDKENADYGRPIAEWSERIRRGLRIGSGSGGGDEDDGRSSGGRGCLGRGNLLGPYGTGDMSQTRFADLTIRLGVMYAYLHQADCEHRFVFSEIRAVSRGDDANRLRYPLVLFRTKSVSRKCDACGLFPGVLITYDDRYAPRVPAYWCRECYDMFHFGVSGQKAYQYKVLPYIYDVT